MGKLVLSGANIHWYYHLMDARLFLSLYLVYRMPHQSDGFFSGCLNTNGSLSSLSSLDLFRGINFVHTQTHPFLNVIHKMISINKRIMIEIWALACLCLCSCFYIEIHGTSNTKHFPTHIIHAFSAFFSSTVIKFNSKICIHWYININMALKYFPGSALRSERWIEYDRFH